METSVNEPELTWNIVTEQINLSKLQIRSVLAMLDYNTPEPEEQVTDDVLIALFVAELLEKIRLTAEQRNLILRETSDARIDALEGELAQICLIDGEYCAATNVTGFIDLNTGDIIRDQLPVPPLETISYNLRELYRRGKQRLINRSGQNATRRQNTDGDVAQPADVCPGAPDGVS